MQLNPSRENNILYLYFITYPSPVKSYNTVSGIYDNHMVVLNCEIKPGHNKPKHRKIYIYKKSNLRPHSMYITHTRSQLKANGKIWQNRSSKPCHNVATNNVAWYPYLLTHTYILIQETHNSKSLKVTICTTDTFQHLFIAIIRDWNLSSDNLESNNLYISSN